MIRMTLLIMLVCLFPKQGFSNSLDSNFSAIVVRITENTSKTDFEKSEILWAKSEELEKEGKIDDALLVAKESLKYFSSKVRYAQVGYMYLRYKKDKEALEFFENAVDVNNPEHYNLIMDMAYANKRLHNNEKAVYYFEKAIDVTPTPKDKENIERLYDIRREHADVSEKWGMYNSLFYSDPDKKHESMQTIQEVFWQPYFNNGKQLQLYGQVWGTLESPDAYGWDYTVSNIGVRYEPLSDYNLVVSAEHFFPLGVEADDDTRLKVGFSWDTGLELEPYVKDWAYVNLFTEEIYSLSNYNWANVTDFRVGRSYRFDELDPLTSFSPHMFFFSTHYSSARPKEQKNYASIGPGLHIRKWYREDKYNAPKSYVDINLSYRFGLSEDDDNIFWLQITNSF